MTQPDIDTVARAVYEAMGDEFRGMGGDDSWKPWMELSFEIADRYRRIGRKVLLEIEATMANVLPLCDFRWPLLDPNEEDRRNVIAHTCQLASGHADHRCACGARPEDD